MRFNNDSMTGMLAPQPEAREEKPTPVTKPMNVSDEHWAKISADTSFMAWMQGLQGKNLFLRFEKIAEYVDRLDRVERARASDDAFNEEMRLGREEREAAEAAHLTDHPTDAMRIASLEARMTALEALAKPKLAKVHRLPHRTTTTDPMPPKDAA